MQRDDPGPGPLAWLLAFVSLLLPWVAAVFGLAGLWQVAHGTASGWWYVAAAGLLLVADIAIGFVWAHRSVHTDQPDLNLRASQIVGRVVLLEEAIEHGRGKARVGDTLWTVEGSDAPAGTEVRITATQGTVLKVEMT